MLRDLFSLFPAHAGVILGGGSAGSVGGAFPRTCGGDPQAQFDASNKFNFSPHMRGVIHGGAAAQSSVFDFSPHMRG